MRHGWLQLLFVGVDKSGNTPWLSKHNLQYSSAALVNIWFDVIPPLLHANQPVHIAVGGLGWRSG